MPKSELVEKLKINVGYVEDTHFAKENTKEALSHDAIQKERLQILKDIHASKNLTDILEAEKTLLASELVKSKVQEDSIKVALAEFNAGLKSLSIIQNKEKYQDANETYFGKTRDSEGLPKDSFRNFITSHKTRLRNKLSNPESEIQTNIFEQRRKNLTLANELYKEKQREVLGLTPQKKQREKKKLL